MHLGYRISQRLSIQTKARQVFFNLDYWCRIFEAPWNAVRLLVALNVCMAL
jgi:hypothetical protein